MDKVIRECFGRVRQLADQAITSSPRYSCLIAAGFPFYPSRNFTSSYSKLNLSYMFRTA